MNQIEQEIANVLKLSRPDLIQEEAYGQWVLTAAAFASRLTSINPGLDANTFLRACDE
jgi:hypothetical protein